MIHFFGTIWAGGQLIELSKKKQVDLLSKLLCIQENGIFNQKKYQILIFRRLIY